MQLIRRILSALIILVIVLVPLEKVSGSDDLPEVVRGTKAIKAGVYIVSRLEIPQGSELILLPGVTLLFDNGAKVLVRGYFRTEGSSEKPVSLLPFQVGGQWSGIFTGCGSGDISLRGAIISGMGEGIESCEAKLALDGVKFTNSTRPLVTVRSQKSELTLKNVSFDASLVGKQTEALGFNLQGGFKGVAFDGIKFPRRGLLEEAVADAYLTLEGSWESFALNSISTGGEGCGLALMADTPVSLRFGAWDSACGAPTVPTVFVPGYGTSINFNKITNARNRSPEMEGWGFIDLLSLDYGSFIQSMKASDIPYGIAFYDWRLPAESAAVSYLKPAIDAAKKKYQSDRVNIVAHSFGGIVARSYVQSGAYQGDVENFVEIATPNAGAAKAYRVWQGGELPSDWRALDKLVMLYAYQGREQGMSRVQAIRKVFPSVSQMLPTYPALRRGGELLPPKSLTNRNALAEKLNASQSDLHNRTRVVTVSNADTPTLEEIAVGVPEVGSWEDGRPLAAQADLPISGDGTVSRSSVQAVAAHVSMEVPGSHMGIVGNAVHPVLASLYPAREIRLPEALPARQSSNILWFAFDCLVEVRIMSPSGKAYDSKGFSPGADVFTNEEATWMLVPAESGEFTVAITALRDEPVRWWVDNQSPHEKSMKRGEVAEYAVGGAAQSDPAVLSPSQDGPFGPESPSWAAFPIPSLPPFAFAVGETRAFMEFDPGLILAAEAPRVEVEKSRQPSVERGRTVWLVALALGALIFLPP